MIITTKICIFRHTTKYISVFLTKRHPLLYIAIKENPNTSDSLPTPPTLSQYLLLPPNTSYYLLLPPTRSRYLPSSPTIDLLISEKNIFPEKWERNA